MQCNEGQGFIKINEIFPNPDGSDSGQEDCCTTREQNRFVSTVGLLRPLQVLVHTICVSTRDNIESRAFLLGEEDVPSEFADLTMIQH